MDVFTKQNDRLEGEVDQLEEQNTRLAETRKAIESGMIFSFLSFFFLVKEQ